MTRLRVALETQFAIGRATGIGVFSRGLADALRARGDVDVVEICDPRFDLWRFDRRVYWDHIRSPRLARASHADVFHFTAGTLPWRPPRPAVLTLHDLVWLRGANRGKSYVRWYFGRLQPAFARHADAVVVDSDAARADVADGLHVDPSRIRVAGVGVDERFLRVERRPADPPFILAVGTVEERKDLATAVRALSRLPTARLVSVGAATPYAREVRRVAGELGVSGRVELRGYVGDGELLQLYATAAALVFPSIYEGFGLPPLQALAAGVPVIAARIPVTEEVLGDCAWFVEPGDAAGIAAAVDEILGGGAEVEQRVERGRRRAREHSWSAVAARMAEIYRSVL